MPGKIGVIGQASVYPFRNIFNVEAVWAGRWKREIDGVLDLS